MNRSFVLTRRSLLACAAAAPLAMTLRPARAAGDVYVRAGANFTPVSIAVTPFVGDDAKVSAVTTNDFAHSIFLTPINPTSFPEAVTNPDARPNVDAWKTINAQFVLTGRVAPSGDHREQVAALAAFQVDDPQPLPRAQPPRLPAARRDHRALPPTGHRTPPRIGYHT